MSVSASLKVIAKKKGKTNKKLTSLSSLSYRLCYPLSYPLSSMHVKIINALLDVFVNNCNATSAAILVLTSTQASTWLLNTETPVV